MNHNITIKGTTKITRVRNSGRWYYLAYEQTSANFGKFSRWDTDPDLIYAGGLARKVPEPAPLALLGLGLLGLGIMRKRRT